jgi:hypothetical protein
MKILRIPIQWVPLLIAIIALAFGGVFAYQQAEKQPQPIQLSKSEALKLMKIEVDAQVAANAARAYEQQLFDTYKITPQSYQLDVVNGQFLPLFQPAPVEPPKKPKGLEKK